MTTTTKANQTHNTTIIVAATTAILSTCTTAILSYYIHKRLASKQSTKLNEQRQAERTGRIRAEVKLRTCLKDLDALQKKSATTTAKEENNDNDDDPHAMALKAIGTITSPFTKRMGTPRQGALSPHSRGFLQLNTSTPIQTLEGMEHYSHCWLIFQFHANTDLGNNISKKTKIKPPRGGGIKVGMLATRSPHRVNCIGLSLVNVEYLDVKEKRLYVRALDLVNGTPVYDVKPCVPWDIPGHFDPSKPLTVPKWVSQDDTLSSVSFSPEARASLKQLMHDGYLSPLYTTKKKNNSKDNNAIVSETTTTTLKDAECAICEVLAQDPRASNTSNSSKKRGNTLTTKDSSDGMVEPYNVIFCSVQIEFVVVEEEDDNGAENKNGMVKVLNVKAMNFEGVEFVDGVPLVGTAIS